MEQTQIEGKQINTPSQRSDFKSIKITVDVSKPYEHKQIDTRWIQLKMNKNITPRAYFASCIQAGKVFLHGGYNEQQGILKDMYSAQFFDLPSEWKQIKMKQKSQKNPPGLRNHTLNSYTSYLILVGGQKSMLQNNQKIYRFDMRTEEWQIVKCYIQKGQQKGFSLPIDSHTSITYHQYLYVFGGYNSKDGNYNNCIFKMNLTELKNNKISVQIINQKLNKNIPSPRGNVSSCVIQNQIYIFGGSNAQTVFSDFWIFNIETQKWRQVQKTDNFWPEARKGHIMVSHAKSRSIFMFGGIKQITKQQNDILVYLVSKQKWIKIHSSTNDLYDPSPTIKKMVQSSPSIIQAKNRKNNSKNKNTQNNSHGFKLGIKSVTCYKTLKDQSFNKNKEHKNIKTQYGKFNDDSPQMKKKLSVVQQKKYRQFLNRKKKLLQDISSSTKDINLQTEKRKHSPTSQAISYSIQVMGPQKQYVQTTQSIPKVIFDEEKGAVIGKKPCARDGHAGLVHQDSIIIIGGDRHMMAFNDVYFFKMDKAIQNIHHYDKV